MGGYILLMKKYINLIKETYIKMIIIRWKYLGIFKYFIDKLIGLIFWKLSTLDYRKIVTLYISFYSLLRNGSLNFNKKVYILKLTLFINKFMQRCFK